MTELEMTRLCAEAMCLPEDEQVTRYVGYREEGHIWTRHEDVIGKMYHPLHDDAQAMALVKKILPRIEPPTTAYGYWRVYRGVLEICADDLNRAIVECCARMQLAKKPTK